MAEMRVEGARELAQQIGLDLFDRAEVAVALVLVPGDELELVRAAMIERWGSLLSAMSSGIAHADDPYADEVAERERRLAVLRRRRLEFRGFGEMPGQLDGVAIAYAIGEPPAAWRDALAGVTVEIVASRVAGGESG